MGHQSQGERGDIPDADARRATSTDPRRPLASRSVHVTWCQKARYCVLDVSEGIRNANGLSVLPYTRYTVQHIRHETGRVSINQEFRYIHHCLKCTYNN